MIKNAGKERNDSVVSRTIELAPIEFGSKCVGSETEALTLKLRCWVRDLILWKDKGAVPNYSSRIQFYNVGFLGCGRITRLLVMYLDQLIVNTLYHHCLSTINVWCSTKPSKRSYNCLCLQHVSLVTSWCRFASVAHRARDPVVCAYFERSFHGFFVILSQNAA